MTPDLVTLRESRAAPVDPEIGRQATPLFQGMLACLQRSRETPLQFEIDSNGIVSAVLDTVPPGGIPGHGMGLRDNWNALMTALDSLAARFLREEAADGKTGDREPAPPGTPPERRRHEVPNAPAPLRDLLAGWLERYYQIMREVSPQAIDIAGLRAEGYCDRDIAERLGLGLRLVTRVVREMRVVWEAASRNE